MEPSVAWTRVLAEGDEWQSWRALRLSGEASSDVPPAIGQDELGGFIGPNGSPSPWATGEALCHLALLGLSGSGHATIAADWLLDARTPVGAWLDSPDQVPGELDDVASSRVLATGAAYCGLTAVGREAGERPLALLRGEADQAGRLTGGAYPTFAAAGAFWVGFGAKDEMAEWALRWCRENVEEWWGPWERATALTFWGASGIPAEHATVEVFLDDLRAGAPEHGWDDDLGLTTRALELFHHFGLWRP